MERRPLGGTGMAVSVLGFGGSEIGYENAAPATVDRLINAALDAGLNLIDTAECYNDSEELIGRAVAHRRGDFTLTTKVGHAAGLPFADWDPRLMEPSIERSLKRLRTDQVDLVQLHSCSEELLRRGELIAALERARAAGKTRFIGYSGDGGAAAFAVQCGRFATLQTSLSIADQEAIELTLPAARAAGMGVIVKRPIANACWRHRRKPDLPYHHAYWERLQRLQYGFLAGDLPAAVETALRFTLAQPGVTTAIVGTANPERWAENALMAAKGPLGEAELGAIRARWREVAPREWTGQT